MWWTLSAKKLGGGGGRVLPPCRPVLVPTAQDILSINQAVAAHTEKRTFFCPLALLSNAISTTVVNSTLPSRYWQLYIDVCTEVWIQSGIYRFLQ